MKFFQLQNFFLILNRDVLLTIIIIKCELLHYTLYFLYMLIFNSVDFKNVLWFEIVECLLVEQFEIVEVIGVGDAEQLLCLTRCSLTHLLHFFLPTCRNLNQFRAVRVL